VKIRPQKEVRNIGTVYKKAIISGNVIEIYEYEHLNVKGGGYHPGDGKDKEENYARTQRRRKNELRRLITQNFEATGSKFVTLTFDNARDFDIKDVKACNRYFKKFIQRLKRRYSEMRYVSVIEFQDKNDRGAVHYHMICNLPYIRKSELAEIWGAGYVKINRIDNVDNVGVYVTAYMTADMDDKRLMGLKAYNASRGLQRPIEAKSWQEEDWNQLRELEMITEKLEPSYCGQYESSEAGHIEYKQYNLSRNNIARKSE
jgi:hypothetical protein